MFPITCILSIYYIIGIMILDPWIIHCRVHLRIIFYKPKHKAETYLRIKTQYTGIGSLYICKIFVNNINTGSP